jgi:hypothetical protein
MKKLIYTILASSLLFSCSSNSSSSDDSNSPAGGLLLKTISNQDGFKTLNYNGNKIVSSAGNGTIYTNTILTYNGDLIIKEESFGVGRSNIVVMNYSNNQLSSLTENTTSPNSNHTHNSTYTYNADGSITELTSGTNSSSGSASPYSSKNIRYYSQGNCYKREVFENLNGVMLLNSTITYTYDSYNTPYKNIIGFYAYTYPQGNGVNNITGIIHKNSTGVITSTTQFNYQYNAQNYPISFTETNTQYNISLDGSTSTPGSPNISSTSYTYY